MDYKFIRVNNEQEYNKAVKYFKDMGYELSTNPSDDTAYRARTVACAVCLNGGGIWASYINWHDNEYNQEHFLPEEPSKQLLPNIYIPVNSEEEFNQAKILVEEMGYVESTTQRTTYGDEVHNITCTEGLWMAGSCEEDDKYFDTTKHIKYLLKSSVTYTLEKPEKKLYDISMMYIGETATKQKILEHIKQLKNLIGE